MSDDELARLIEMARDIERAFRDYVAAPMWSDEESRLHRQLQSVVRQYLDEEAELTDRYEREDPLRRERWLRRYEDGSAHDLLDRAVFCGGSKGEIEAALRSLLGYYRVMNAGLEERERRRRDAEF